MAKSTNYQNNVYTPHDVGMIGHAAAKRAAEHSQFGIELEVPGTIDPSVGEYFAPLLPWEICAVQAQTSHGKTYFTDWWIRQIAAQLKRQSRDEIIIKVSLEESIEAQAFQEYGRILGQRPANFARGTFTDWARMEWAMTEIDMIPVWRIGDSAERAADAPELTLSNIYRAIRELVTGNITGDKWKAAVVVIDYLQALPIDPEVKQATREQQRRLQVAQDVFRLREMTTHLQCPIIVPLQAKQDLGGNNAPMMIPGTYDGLETSTIATRFDRIISLWMPKMTHVIGQTIQAGDRVIAVKENQVFLKVNKQRGGLPSGRIWELAINYEKHEYADVYSREAK